MLDYDQLMSRLQSHFGDGLVTVVGSGLSCAEGLPGMGELAGHLDVELPRVLQPVDLSDWSKLAPVIKTEGLEAALLKSPPSGSLEAAIVAHSAAFIAGRERGIVAEVFLKKRTLRFSRLAKHLLKPSTGIPIVTTNYDRLVEIAVEEVGLGVDTMFVGDFAGSLNEAESRMSFCREVTLQGKMVRYHFRDRATVFKPHGSLDWYHRESRPVRFAGDLDLPRLIITPGLNKFRNGYDSPFDRHREKANGAIDQAARFVIIGYGFNDDHLETHLTPRIRAGVPTLLLTYELTPNALALARACSNVIAIERAVVAGAEGTRVHLNRAAHELPSVNLWDLGCFITEVLEP